MILVRSFRVTTMNANAFLSLIIFCMVCYPFPMLVQMVHSRWIIIVLTFVLLGMALQKVRELVHSVIFIHTKVFVQLHALVLRLENNARTEKLSQDTYKWVTSLLNVVSQGLHHIMTLVCVWRNAALPLLTKAEYVFQDAIMVNLCNIKNRLVSQNVFCNAILVFTKKIALVS